MEINYKDSLLIVRNALTKDQCSSLISEYEKEKDKFEYENCTHAITGNPTQSTFKRICLNPRTKNFDIIHSATKNLIQQWLEYLESKKMFHTHALKNVLKYSHMYRLLKYEPGGWIHPHIDWDHFVHASCTFNLNEDYIGGQFSFFNGIKTKRFAKVLSKSIRVLVSSSLKIIIFSKTDDSTWRIIVHCYSNYLQPLILILIVGFNKPRHFIDAAWTISRPKINKCNFTN